MRGIIVSYSQPIRFVRLNSEQAQSDGESRTSGVVVPEVAILSAYQKERDL